MNGPKAKSPKSIPKPGPGFTDQKATRQRRQHSQMGGDSPQSTAAYFKHIQAVTFDVGGTLIGCWPSVGHIYAEVADRFGHHNLSPTLLNRRFKTAWGRLKDFRHTRQQWSALVDETFHGMIQPLPSKTFFAELYERFSQPDAWHIFEDVIPTLQGLRSRGFKLGVVSNWDDRLRPLLRKLKLDRFFTAIVVSCELGAPKPAALMFHSACAALNCPTANTLHVGDSREMDFEAARRAGLQGLWLRRGAKRIEAHSILSLSELNKL